MTKLSVNINKFATLRNSRGGNNPDVVKAAIDAQRFGADGVTVHPRPDERHIRYEDVRQIKKIITAAFNAFQRGGERAAGTGRGAFGENIVEAITDDRLAGAIKIGDDG